MGEVEIKIYAHGKPRETSQWGVLENDREYIKAFYSKEAADVWMEVNVRKSGEGTYCYYTYIRKNILGNEDRMGSYFALTVRLNCYYRNILFLYVLLDDLYDSFIIGNILEIQGGRAKYLIDNFNQKDSFFKELGNKIYERWRTWSDSDFIPLKGFNTSSSSGLKMNLSDGGNERIEELVRKNGSISVSPEFPSEEVEKLRGEIKNMKAEASRKESDIRNSYKEHLENERTEHRQKISMLEQERGKERDKNQELENKLSSKENEIKEYITQRNKILNILTQHSDDGSFEGGGKGTPTIHRDGTARQENRLNGEKQVTIQTSMRLIKMTLRGKKL